MLMRLDHAVILVRDLERATRDYQELGFGVTPGGEHADGLTKNALIPFRDGSYLELVAFVDSDDPRDNAWGWRPFLSAGRGLIDYCAASDGLAADARRLTDAGFRVNGPDEGGRRLPDGSEIRWRSASVDQDGRVLPFLIEDLTPRSSRVPSGAAAQHPNGATGISRLHVTAPDAGEAAETLALLAAEHVAGLSVPLGASVLSFVVPDTEGSGPSALDLAVGQSGDTGELDPELTHGASIRLVAV